VAMLWFMDYVQSVFQKASNWNLDNSYGSLTATSRCKILESDPFSIFQQSLISFLALLDFETPNGIRLNVSSLASPNLATSYTLGSVGLVDGSVSYLYSSLPIRATSRSSQIQLRNVIEGYRQLQELKRPDEPWWWETWKGGRRVDRRDALLYGRMYLPDSTLEALYLRRLSPTQQVKISCVSDARLKHGGTVSIQAVVESRRQLTSFDTDIRSFSKRRGQILDRDAV
jgi:distribution and morphology protein 10